MDEIQELLSKILEEQDQNHLHELIEEHYAINVAEDLEERGDEDISAFLSFAYDEDLASVLEDAEDSLRFRLLSPLSIDRLTHVFSFMSPDDITDLISLLPIPMRKDLFSHMNKDDSQEVRMLLGFAPDSAGGIMTTKYIALKSNLTPKQALMTIRDIGPRTEVIEEIFIVDNRNVLLGHVNLRDILSAPDNSRLNDIMKDNPVTVSPYVDQEEASLLVSKYDLLALPVVNVKNVLLGIITVDDVLDVIVEENTEDFLMVSGVNKNETIGGKISESIKHRLPWLVINLVTAFLAAFTIDFFQDVIVQVVALAAAMPIVTGMGGNAGTQTLSIVITGLATGDLNLKDDWRYVLNELAIGLFDGAVIGILTAIVLYFMYGNLFLGVIIFLAMIGNMIIAGFFGFMIPLVLEKFHLDAAVSSSIFLTTATDVGGFFLFLGLAKLFLPLLL